MSHIRYVRARPRAEVAEGQLPAARSLLMRHSTTLNVRYDQSQADWDRVAEVYRSMPDRRHRSDTSWFGNEGDPERIWVSVEPSGILLEAQMGEAAWSKWIGELCARLTAALDRPVHDAERDNYDRYQKARCGTDGRGLASHGQLQRGNDRAGLPCDGSHSHHQATARHVARRHRGPTRARQVRAAPISVRPRRIMAQRRQMMAIRANHLDQLHRGAQVVPIKECTQPSFASQGPLPNFG